MYELLKSQKNEVFKMLQEEGLETTNFSWVVGEYKTPSTDPLTAGLTDVVQKVPKLIYKNSQFYFQFGLLRGQHHCTFSPGREKPIEQQFPGAWVHQRNYIREWTTNLKREIEAPDLWSEIEKYRAELPLVADEQLVNEPIPDYEVDEIADKLQLLADKIEQQFKPDEEQKQFVRSKLNYLADAAKRQPRRDWENIFISVFITIAFQLALEPNKAQQFWQLVKGIIGPFIHLIGS